MGSLISNVFDSDLVVTTINYSGILTSPFEFYSEEHLKDETELSIIFQKLIQQEFKEYDKNTFKWGLGKIDQKMQKERYSPVYRQDAGIEKQVLLGQEAFKKKWNQVFENNFQLIPGFQFTPQERDRCRTFDLLCYKTIVYYVYKVNNLEQIKKENTEPYALFMKKFFSKAFLNEEKKIAKTLDAIEKEKVDIMFFQEANQKLMNSICHKQFKVVSSEHGNSIIVIRKDRFKKIHDQKKVLQTLSLDITESLHWNKDTAIAFVDNLILFSGHLSSKKEKNAEQIKKMLDSLEKMRNRYPNEHLIAGCDVNSFIRQIPSFLKQYPTQETQYTTLKKRTMMQPQVNKANVVAQQCRDVLLSDLNLRKARVVSILDKKSENVGFLPCEEHPYDHFVVTAYINPKEE